MVRLMMILSMMFFVSCGDRYQIGCDISFEKQRCRCRCLDAVTLKETDKKNCKKDWKKYFLGVPEKHPVNYRPSMCEGIMGFRIEEIAKDIIPAIKEERAKCEDRG